MKEIWKDVLGFEGFYTISNIGRIKNNRGWIIKDNRNRNKYICVTLTKDKIRKNYLTHRLVAKSFINNPDNKPVVNHKDGNKYNNNVDNLEWCTKSENVKHAFKIGLGKVPDNNGENHPNRKLNNKLVREIRTLFLVTHKFTDIYSHFKVSPRTIRDVVNKITWRSVV